MLISFDGYAMCNPNMTGVGQYAHNLIKSIVRLDYKNQYTVCAFDLLKKRNYKKLLQQYFNTTNIEIRTNYLFSYTFYMRYYEMFRGLSYNLFSPGASIYHFSSVFVPEKVTGKTIATVHDMVHIKYPETMNKINYEMCNKHTKRVCQQVDFIVTSSQNSKNEIAEFMGVALDKIIVANGAVDRALFSPSPDHTLLKQKYNIQCPYILYLGTLEPRKNIPMLIKAFKIAEERCRGIKLVLAGDKGWKYEDIDILINDLKLSDKIIFTGYIDKGDMPALYSCAELFVFPSLYEGFGIPPLEAMACGIPVIVSNTSSLPEVVGDAGILVSPTDIEELAYQIVRIIDDRVLHKSLSEKSLLQADRFSWDTSAEIILDLYKRFE